MHRNLISVFFALTPLVEGFVVKPDQHRRYRIIHQSKDSKEIIGGDLFTKALFSAAELLGKARSALLPNGEADSETNSASSSGLKNTALRIQDEYLRVFWVTGKMDLSLYSPDCLFRDPFSSFGGTPGCASTARFAANARNLGSLVDVNSMKASVTNVTVIEVGEPKILVSWTFSSQLKLPWRPFLAASGVTTHVVDPESGLICRYEETWKSKPLDVVKRLFVPGPPAESS